MEKESTQLKIDVLSDIVNNNSLLKPFDIQKQQEENDNTINIETLLNDIKNNKQDYDESMLLYEKEIVNKGLSLLRSNLINTKEESIANSQKNLDTVELWKKSYDKLNCSKMTDKVNIDERHFVYRDNSIEEQWCSTIISKLKE